jgi:hypothetical protein
MSSFYFDNHVSLVTATNLREYGHNVVATRDRRAQRQRDFQQMITATNLGRLLVTHNERDYILLYRAWHFWSEQWGAANSHNSTSIVIPQFSSSLLNWGPPGAVRSLSDFANQRPLAFNCLFIWHARDVWTVHPPHVSPLPS